MTSTNFNNQVNKILSVIKKKGGFATKTDLKRSINEFNRDAAGVATLEKVLAYMVTQEILFEHLHEASNGTVVSFYRQNNSQNADCGDPARNNPDDIPIRCTFDFTIGAGRELIREAVEQLASRIKADELVESLLAHLKADSIKDRETSKSTKAKPQAASKPESRESISIFNETPFDFDELNPLEAHSVSASA